MPAIDKSSRHPRRPSTSINHLPSLPKSVLSAAKRVRREFPSLPHLGLILGSGCTGVTQQFRISARIPYAAIPGLGAPTVAGHAGELLHGTLQGQSALIFSGRRHYYEGCAADQILFPVRMAAALGVKSLIITNAAGSLRPAWKPGNWMRVTDHINGMGFSPLRESCPKGANRFVDLTEAYDSQLGDLMEHAAKIAGVRLRRGVYFGVAGPNYETPAEIRAFRILGADAVGMSTIPEVIAARQLSMRVVAMSCLTNLAAGLQARSLNHEEVLETGKAAGASLAKMLEMFFELYPQKCR